MDALSFIGEIVRDLLIFVGAMFALLVVLIIVVSKLANDNPLKRVLSALCYRIGATAAAGLVAIPVEPIPGLDALYDIAIPLLLIWYWFTFFRDAMRASYGTSASRELPSPGTPKRPPR
jgi:hypothetical protein